MYLEMSVGTKNFKETTAIVSLVRLPDIVTLYYIWYVPLLIHLIPATTFNHWSCNNHRMAWYILSSGSKSPVEAWKKQFYRSWSNSSSLRWGIPEMTMWFLSFSLQLLFATPLWSRDFSLVYYHFNSNDDSSEFTVHYWKHSWWV